MTTAPTRTIPGAETVPACRESGLLSALCPDQARAPALMFLTAVLAFAVYLVLPADMNELARRTASIFVIAAVLWATEALPLFATSFVVIGLQIVLLADDGGWAHLFPAISDFPAKDGQSAEVLSLSYTQILKPFSSGIIILFMGGFLISQAVTRTGLDKVIAGRVLEPLTRRPTMLLFGVLGITAFFSMWMSNTATTAMMLAVAAPLIATLPRGSRFHRAIILAIPFGANIGGIGTPIGTPPNAVALANLRAAGHEIGFLDWMMIAVPLELVLLVGAGALLYFCFPPERGMRLVEMEPPGRLDRSGGYTCAVLVGAVLLWLTAEWHGMSEPATALIAAAALTALRVLDRKDVDSIDWNILILMWGGLAMGNAMQQTGLVHYFVNLPIMGMDGWLLAIVVAVASVMLATFMSHTAAAALVVPMAMALSSGEGAHLGILAALACSFAMAFPISTPPNAMTYATRTVRVSDMIRTGGFISLAGVAIMLIGYRVMIPMILHSP